jgi:hypothetical protein
MNPLQKSILRSAARAAVAVGAAAAACAPIAARADSFAQSILVIDNFRLLHANGTTYSSAEFPQLPGGGNAYASGQLNGVYNGATQAADLASGVSLDVAQQNAGAGLSARPENDATPNAGAAGPQGSFGYGDQRMTGSIITTPVDAAATPFQSRTRADAALDSDGSASGVGGVATSTAFSFSLGAGEYMTIAFDATPFTRAQAGGAGAAAASIAWSVVVLDLSTGATVFSLQPEQLNAMSRVSSNGFGGGGAIYDPGRLSFAATIGMLDAGDTYQVTFAQTSFASALQSQQVPEPATLAGFGAGLLALAALGRRRRNGRAGGRAKKC